MGLGSLPKYQTLQGALSQGISHTFITYFEFSFVQFVQKDAVNFQVNCQMTI